MKKQQIKDLMISIINEKLRERKDEVLEEIDEETVKEFIWSVDYGKELADDYIKSHNIIVNYLYEIYVTISYDDLDAPF